MARKIAFIIGINQYKYLDETEQLCYAERDAVQISQLLTELRFDEVFCCARSNQTSGNDLTSKLQDISTKIRLNKLDTLWFFFSGHGARQNGYDYLLPTDGNPRYLEKTALKVSDVIHDLTKCGAGNLVFILDACRNVIKEYTKGLGSQTEEMAKQEGVMAIFSCRPGKQSYEIPEIQHGSFTYALLHALRNECKPEQATFEQLNRCLKQYIRNLHQQYSRPEQEPWVVSEPVDRYTGIILPSSNSRASQSPELIEIDKLKVQASEAFFAGDLDRAEQLWFQMFRPGISQEDFHVATNAINLINSQRQSKANVRLPSQPELLLSKNVTTPIDPPETLPSTISIDDTPAANPPIQPKSDTAHLQLAADGIRGLTQPPVAEPINLDRAPADLSPTLPSQPAQPAAQPPDTPQSAPSTKRRTTRKKAAIEPTDAEPIDPRLKLATRSISFEVVKLNSQGQEQSRETKQAKCFREDLGNGVYLEMVAIPGGEFMMGGSGRDESPIHKVTIQPFYFGRYAVTQEQWKAVLELPKVKDDLKLQAKFGGKMRPVEFISYSQAVEFCNRLAQKTGRVYRLPSEAEWEYACRAGSSTPYHFGEAISGEFVNFKDVKYSHQTKRVDFSKVANDFGLSEMHGNLLEWCADRWHQNYEQAPADGSVWLANGDLSWGVTRGGSWDMPATRCTSSYRHNRLWNTTQNKFIGFRIALSGETS